ncbi:succinate dehydrogenase [ubiquinone] cytochrome b small subunit, mitochondrial isoform X2 [Harpegnathos saltator]|uniref:succinate dehydrogenase [ubiquinone] cytochrome b small subunit, mitochondrial isoform X2 n=1 Tax=Harpegnathos saltator TaxID=610380 RepID=UPI000DBED618|nr:succinate dehydrogenase [ubiquinone] cytochrome b small subunit, mitochondrial isoform X2 [Harpegnathos saltator]
MNGKFIIKSLAKPAGLLVRRCNLTQFPKPTSSLANLNHSAIVNTNNYTRYRILPKLPARLTVNATQTRASSTHGDHVRLWIVERLVSVSLLTLLPAALVFESKFVDGVLAIAVVMHSHWGLEAIIVDYVRPIVFGTIMPKVATLMLNLLSIATLTGLLLLIYNGPGLTKVIKQMWAVSSSKTKTKTD